MINNLHSKNNFLLTLFLFLSFCFLSSIKVFSQSTTHPQHILDSLKRIKEKAGNFEIGSGSDTNPPIELKGISGANPTKNIESPSTGSGYSGYDLDAGTSGTDTETISDQVIDEGGHTICTLEIGGESSCNFRSSAKDFYLLLLSFSLLLVAIFIYYEASLLYLKVLQRKEIWDIILTSVGSFFIIIVSMGRNNYLYHNDVNIFYNPDLYSPMFILASLPLLFIGFYKFFSIFFFQFGFTPQSPEEQKAILKNKLLAIIGGIFALLNAAASIITLFNVF